MRTRVKICGLKNVDMAIEAVEQGADAIGLVFYSPSPRNIAIDEARDIVQALPAFVTAVGLFVNEHQDVVRKTIEQTGINLLQFHGEETPEYCASFDFPYIKALRMKADVDVSQHLEMYASARSLLLDTYQAGTPGGTGETFNWELIPEAVRCKVILAGGLNPENVTSAINTVHPYGVDVSGGVESEKGVKSADKIKQFMRGVSIADK